MTLIISCFVVAVVALCIDSWLRQRQHDKSVTVPENYDFNEMFDDIHVEHAKAILRARSFRTGAPQLGPEHYTCTKCPSQLNCAFAFDEFNTDGDCHMLK